MTNEELGVILTAIAVETGGDTQRLEPKMIVDMARDPKHPLHENFEWDNSIAGEKFRIQQARQLIRTAKFEVRTPERITLEAPMFVRDPRSSSHRSGYIPTLTVKTDADLAREVVLRDFGSVAAALKRAQTFAIALGLGAEIDVMMEQIGVLITKVSIHDQPQGSA